MNQLLSQSVSLAKEGNVAVVTIDNPPVNALSFHVREGLRDAVAAIATDDAIAAAVLICAGRTFVSGADIREFGKPPKPPMLDDVLAAIEACPKPIVAAIHGKALGGGLELAMTCHDRIAAARTQFGLPEVKLGIIPGAGGTQRLPRLTDLATAIAMAVDARTIGAARACDAGLIAKAVDGDLRDAAIAHARDLAASGAPARACDRPMPPRDDALVAEARAAIARRYRLEPARSAALAAILRGYDTDFHSAVREGRVVATGLLDTPQSRALRHAFFAEREVGRMPGLPEGTVPRTIATVGVVGLGTMGAGIAASLAEAGLSVVVKDRDGAEAGRGMARIGRILAGQVKRGKLSESAAAQVRARIGEARSLDALADADLVIEAIVEDNAAKHALFAALGRIARPGAVLASNTSYLDIAALAQASGRPADVAGLHFFNPANVMRLVEIVRTQHTAPAVMATLAALAKRLGKIAVLSGNAEGFIVNRMLAKRSREVYFMLEEGAQPEAIDGALKDFGFPMGPLALGDLAGIDLQHAARQARLAGFGARETAADFVDQLYAMGRYGRKTGAGWYRYDDDGKPEADPVVEAMLAAHAERRGFTRRAFTAEEIVARATHAMIAEGAVLLDEGIAARPHDIDIAMIHGIGWPATTGGPMWQAGEIGLDSIAARIAQFATGEDAGHWQVPDALSRRAAAGKTFYD